MKLWSVNAKLGTMRKVVDWSVYPKPTNVGDDYHYVLIQSDNRICRIDLNTKKGILSAHCPNGAYHYHLLQNTTEVDIPQDLMDQILQVRPKSGDSMVVNGTTVMRIG